ncbi:hypothetical protein [Streptomyces sp. NPDC001070]
MDDLVGYLIVTGSLAAVMGLFTWLARVIRRHGLAGQALSAALASYEEAFRVTSCEAHQEIRAQADRKVPFESPDEPWRPARAGLGPRPGARLSPGHQTWFRRIRHLRRGLGR